MHKYTRACRNSYFLFCITVISAVINPLYASDTTAINPETEVNGIIDKIIIDGNKRTKTKTIHLYMDIDSGDIYDSSRVAEAEKRLKDSKLFDHVKIFTIPKEETVTLLVVVREKRYFTISNYGGVIYDRRYGEPTEHIWLQGYGTVTFNNFGGRNEQLNISASLIRVRYVGLSWYKPFITIPYYVKLGTRIGSYPSVVTPWHVNFFNSSFLTYGRKFGTDSRLYSTLLGRYMSYTWKGGDGILEINGERITKLPDDPELPPMIKDSDWTYHKIDSIILDNNGQPIDTLYDEYVWDGFSSWKINKYEDPFTELYLSIGWITDKRDQYFNPHKGFYYSFIATTNALWPYKDINIADEDIRYLQLSNDFSFFHRGIWESNTVAYRVRPLIRLFGKGNIYSGIYMGSETSLRGYGHGAFGSYEYNHQLLFSWEYRFPIVTLPEMSFPWLSWYHKSMNSLRSRIDGALILDCGYIWKDFENLIHPVGDHVSAAGAGFGFRFMFPSLRRSVCAEIIWPIYPKEYADGWPPALYLYLDLPY